MGLFIQPEIRYHLHTSDMKGIAQETREVAIRVAHEFGSDACYLLNTPAASPGIPV